VETKSCYQNDAFEAKQVPTTEKVLSDSPEIEIDS